MHGTYGGPSMKGGRKDGSKPSTHGAGPKTIGYTLEELDAFGPLDTLPYSLDSEAWISGAPRRALPKSGAR